MTREDPAVPEAAAEVVARATTGLTAETVPGDTAETTHGPAPETIAGRDPETIAGRDPATGDGLLLHLRDGMIDRIQRCPADDLTDGAPYLAPGLIDIQVNGYGGFDVNGESASVEGVVAITERLASEGITTWIPTVITASEEMICRSLALVAQAKAENPTVDAAVPFAHVEGPFLSELDGPRGVHDAQHIRPIDAAEVARWAEAGPVGYVTVSPHWEHSAAEISQIVAGGVAVALGHTHAGPEQILAAADAGATLATHLGNGIFAELPRHPNALWTQLADDRLTCGLIADGHHLPADTLRAMLRSLGGDRAVLVSDSVELAGSAPGRYQTAVGGTVELSDAGRLSYVGTSFLAGAAVNLAHGLEYTVARTGTSLSDALNLVTRNPGRVIARCAGGVTRVPRGVLVAGARADVVELSPAGVIRGVLRGGVRLR